jgi:hypothetical protein
MIGRNELWLAGLALLIAHASLGCDFVAEPAEVPARDTPPDPPSTPPDPEPDPGPEPEPPLPGPQPPDPGQLHLGIWIQRDELRNLPMSGAEWERIVEQANEPAGVPNLSDGYQMNNVYVLAKALVFARTGDERYRTEVRAACIAAIGTELAGKTLYFGRELGAYVIAADLVGLSTEENTRFKDWLRNGLRQPLDGATLVSTHEERPNNWGTHAGGARAAVAAYLGDEVELARCALVFRGWLGDRTAYAGFRFGDLYWQADPSRPVGVNPRGAVLAGYNVDGVLPDDQRRAGPFTWPPPAENYVYEALQGVLMQAVILYNAGYDVWNWEDQAILRAYRWLYDVAHFPAQADDTWQLPVVDYYYGTSFWGGEATRPGKNMGWTGWTHGARIG